MMMCQLTD
jgi:hypothetical protein